MDHVSERNIASPKRVLPPRRERLRSGILALTLACAAGLPCLAQTSAPEKPAAPTPETKPADVDPFIQFDRLQAQAFKAIEAKDYPKAEGLLKEQLALQPDSFVVLYNLACVRALQNDTTGGFDYLKRSISKGYVTRTEIEADPMLANVRALPEYKAMIESWGAILDAHRDAGLRLAKSLFPDAKQDFSDERLRLTYINAFHENSFESARDEISKLADWAHENIFPEILDPEKMQDDAWVVVVLPSTRDFKRWAVDAFGPGILEGFSTVGGAYNHDVRRLIAQDLGPTLRHEFFHVLHWRSMTRLNQRHPTWVQEGVCSLVEDYDLVDGKLSPTTSWRTNTVQRMSSARVLLPIRTLASRNIDQFQGQRRMGLYAQSRAVFLYLWQKGKLKDWYTRYTAEYNEDPTGVLSLERTVGMKAEDFDKEFREWIDGLTLVPEEMRTGMATLGVQVDTGTGEGPVVQTFQKRPPTPRVKTGKGEDSAKPPATPDRLQPGDIITAIDGQPVRDLPELLRRMGKYTPGQTVKLSVRRVKLLKSIDVTLAAYRE